MKTITRGDAGREEVWSGASNYRVPVVCEPYQACWECLNAADKIWMLGAP